MMHKKGGCVLGPTSLPHTLGDQSCIYLISRYHAKWMHHCHDICHKPRLHYVRKIFGSDIEWHAGSKRSTVAAGVAYRNTTSQDCQLPSLVSRQKSLLSYPGPTKKQ